MPGARCKDPLGVGAAIWEVRSMTYSQSHQLLLDLALELRGLSELLVLPQGGSIVVIVRLRWRPHLESTYHLVQFFLRLGEHAQPRESSDTFLGGTPFVNVFKAKPHAH